MQEIVAQSKSIGQTFGSSHVNQMLTVLFKGMVFKNQRGKYVLTVPLLNEYIRRRIGAESIYRISIHGTDRHD